MEEMWWCGRGGSQAEYFNSLTIATAKMNEHQPNFDWLEFSNELAVGYLQHESRYFMVSLSCPIGWQD